MGICIALNPNDRIGYGIPDMKKAFSNLLIEYATSSASLNGSTVTVNWNSKDVAAMKYEIERKAPGENNYTKIGELNPIAGTILTNRSYQFVNNLSNVTSGIVSYRIRQIIDSSVSSFTGIYIDTTSVILNSLCPPEKGFLISLFPNPSIGQVTLLVETDFAVPDMPVSIYDTHGRLLEKLKLSKGIGRAAFDLPFNRFTKGSYIIVVFNNKDRICTAKLIRL